MKHTLAANIPATGLRMKTLVFALAAAFGATPAWATAPVTLTVGAGGDTTDTTDCASASNTTCTLRGALSAANDGDTIVFASSLSNGTITFITDDAASVGVFPGPTALVISGKSVTMDASALAQPLTLSGNDARRLFYVSSTGGLILKGINLTHGKALGYDGGTGSGGGGGGGGAGLGGAILSEGSLTVESVALSQSQVTGGTGGTGTTSYGNSGGGGGGTAGSGGSGSAGAGGGGAAGTESGGAGSFGGGGGGGANSGSIFYYGGAGGFGGGGGGGGTAEGASVAGGAQGWSAGAGGAGTTSGGGGGGGGAGLGGALFVKAGSVTLKNTTFSNNTAQNGSGGLSDTSVAVGNGSGYGGGIFVCTATEGGVNCSGSLNETASCGNSFGSGGSANTAATGQVNLYWSGASGGTHDTTGLTDICKTPPIMGNVPDQTPTAGVAITQLDLSGYVTLTESDPITSYAVASGSLPTGLSLNTSSGAITGTPTTAGTYDITVTASDDAGASNTDAVRFTVGIGSQTITFNALADKAWGAAPFAVNASASSSLTVSFTSQTPDYCSISGGNTVTLLAIGTCTIRASQGGDSNYTAAVDVDRSFAVLAPASTALPDNAGDTDTGSGHVTVTGAAPGAPNWNKFQFIPVSGNPDSPPSGSAPAGYSFFHGLFDFIVNGMSPGGTLVLNVTWPQPIPEGAVYWKYGPTSDNNTPHWYQFPVTYSPDRRTVTLTIVDGGLGDDDLSVNGTIVDQNGPSQSTATAVPSMDAWGLIALSGLLGMAGLRARRRKW